jgi:uncharacterized protein YjbJ (UPF0337 family)
MHDYAYGAEVASADHRAQAHRLPYHHPMKHVNFFHRGHTNMADDLGTDGLKNQVKGAAKEAAGKVQKNVGDLTDDTSQELKGTARELEGKAQRKVGETESRIDRKT